MAVEKNMNIKQAASSPVRKSFLNPKSKEGSENLDISAITGVKNALSSTILKRFSELVNDTFQSSREGVAYDQSIDFVENMEKNINKSLIVLTAYDSKEDEQKDLFNKKFINSINKLKNMFHEEGINLDEQQHIRELDKNSKKVVLFSEGTVFKNQFETQGFVEGDVQTPYARRGKVTISIGGEKYKGRVEGGRLVFKKESDEGAFLSIGLKDVDKFDELSDDEIETHLTKLFNVDMTPVSMVLDGENLPESISVELLDKGEGGKFLLSFSKGMAHLRDQSGVISMPVTMEKNSVPSQSVTFNEKVNVTIESVIEVPKNGANYGFEIYFENKLSINGFEQRIHGLTAINNLFSLDLKNEEDILQAKEYLEEAKNSIHPIKGELEKSRHQLLNEPLPQNTPEALIDKGAEGSQSKDYDLRECSLKHGYLLDLS